MFPLLKSWSSRSPKGLSQHYMLRVWCFCSSTKKCGWVGWQHLRAINKPLLISLQATRNFLASRMPELIFSNNIMGEKVKDNQWINKFIYIIQESPSTIHTFFSCTGSLHGYHTKFPVNSSPNFTVSHFSYRSCKHIVHVLFTLPLKALSLPLQPFLFFYFLYQTDICFFVSFFFCCTTGEESGLAWNIYRKRLVRRASSGTNTPSQNRQHSRACQHVALYYSSDGLSLSYATAISRLKYHRLHISKTHCTDISPFGVVKFCRVCQCVRRIWLSFGMLQSCCGGAVETVCCFQALAESTGYLQLWDFPNFPELVPRD